jgi:CheY-like chemotaxis protein
MDELGGRDRYVLLVEDDADIGAVASTILREEVGLSVLWAPTGDRALEIAAQRRPSLVLLDLSMPGLDGLEVLRRLRASPGTRDVPVVIVTAMAPTGPLRAAAEAAGCDDFLPKPFALDALIEVTERWLARA